MRLSGHPLNLALRFILEIAGLIAMGYWGWRQADGVVRFALAVGIPIIAAALWAVFRVPGDPGSAPVAVPGLIRLLLEAAFFGFAVWALNDAGAKTPAVVLALLVVLHYATSIDRVISVLRK